MSKSSAVKSTTGAPAMRSKQTLHPFAGSGKICHTLREAIHHTYLNSRRPAKELAGELDWAPSELSLRTSLGENARPFPADDEKERIVIIMRESGDYSYLLTLCEKCGFEAPRVKEVYFPAMLEDFKRDVMPRIQQVFEFLREEAGGRK